MSDLVFSLFFQGGKSGDRGEEGSFFLSFGGGADGWRWCGLILSYVL